MPMAMAKRSAQEAIQNNNYSAKATKIGPTPICRSTLIPFHTPNLCNACSEDCRFGTCCVLSRLVEVPVEERMKTETAVSGEGKHL